MLVIIIEDVIFLLFDLLVENNENFEEILKKWKLKNKFKFVKEKDVIDFLILIDVVGIEGD